MKNLKNQIEWEPAGPRKARMRCGDVRTTASRCGRFRVERKSRGSYAYICRLYFGCQAGEGGTLFKHPEDRPFWSVAEAKGQAELLLRAEQVTE